jgi:hypothetical protein
MAELTREQMRERLGNIDQIRDIIVGSQLREYDTRFEHIETELSLVRQDMRDRVEQLRNAFSLELRAAVDSLEKKIKTVSLNAQDESADLRQQMDRINKKFSNTIEALDESVDKQTSLLKGEISETRVNLQEDVRNLRTHILEELDRQFSTLRDAKIARDDMAEILFELGMRLKGSEFVRQLKEATDNEIYTGLAILEPNDSSDGSYR